MSDDAQAMYQDIAQLLDCQQKTIDLIIGTLCLNLTVSPVNVALLVYWLIQTDRRDHPVYKQFMMVFNRIKKQEEAGT